MEQDKKDKEKKGFTVQDHRWWLQDPDKVEAAEDTVNLRPPSYVEELEKRLEEKDRTLRDYIQAHKSSVAEMDDARQRLEKEVDRRVLLKQVRMLEPFIEVLDNLKRLLSACQTGQETEHIEQGMDLVIKQLESELQRSGLEPISAVGQRFDPKLMEALMTVEVGENQVDQVLEEIRTGYTLNQQIVRPAGVQVGVARKG